MPISIYPPTLASTQPAFLASSKNYSVFYTLQSMTGRNSIGHVQIRVVDQLSNSSIVKTAIYPDGIIYKNASDAMKDGGREGLYYTEITRDDLREDWTPGRCYKIQVRFGTTERYEIVRGQPINFADWKKKQTEEGTFSEWSTVMVIKAIDSPVVEIANAGVSKPDTVNTTNVENSLTPLFTGVYSISGNSNEILDKYKFDLYDEEDSFIETSDWIAAVNQSISYRFKTILTNNANYKVRFTIVTINGYEAYKEYSFQVKKTYLEAIENVGMVVKGNQDIYCRDNGCIKVCLYPMTNTPMALTGCYVLTRTSEKSNYGVYEDIKYFNLFEGSYTEDKPLYFDFTIESGVRYKYGFQYQNSQGLRSTMIEYNQPVSVDFEYSYIYRDGIQLKLSLNQKVNTFKHTVLASKQDTLGDRYPHLVKNGHAHYAEFPISGTISYQMDKDDTFFSTSVGGCYFKDELIVPFDKFKTEGERGSQVVITSFDIDTNLTEDNVFIERKFREKVEEFLNDFDYKLYKSPTEGNIVIGLLNVSMTPNATLGRMIFDFSATAYEVMENTLEALNEVGIIHIGEFTEEQSVEVDDAFGQIAGVYASDTSSYPADKDIYSLVRQQEEIIVGDGKYQLNLQQINSFWVERYPEVDVLGKRYELEANKQEAEEAGDTELVKELQEQIDYYEGLQTALNTSAAGGFARLSVNGAEVVVAPNRYYAVEGGIQSLSIISAPYPIIINYTVSLTRGRNEEAKEVASIDVSHVWGQISGVFTDDKAILQRYIFDYREGQAPYRVYGTNPPAKLSDPSFGSAVEFETDYAWDKANEYYYVIVDSTNYNLYKTRNLYEIIKEETRKMVEHIYLVKDGFYLDDDGNWTDGTIYYTFSDIISFTIEADPYTELEIGTSKETAQTVRLGPTGRYTLSPMDGLVRYINLPKAQHAIVDYKCLTSQTRMK